MSMSIPVHDATPPQLTMRQLVQMREHLARHYAHFYRARISYHELRDAGEQVIAGAPMTADAHTIYRQIKQVITRRRPRVRQYTPRPRRKRHA